MMNKENLSPKEQEALFQEAINDWEITKSKASWDRMWFRVLECCKAMAIHIAPGKPLVEERSVDAAIMVMDRIIRLKTHPRKLSSYCYWPVREAIHGPKVVHEDMEEEYYEEYEEQTRDYILGIVQPSLMNTED